MASLALRYSSASRAKVSASARTMAPAFFRMSVPMTLPSGPAKWTASSRREPAGVAVTACVAVVRTPGAVETHVKARLSSSHSVISYSAVGRPGCSSS